MGNAGEFLRLVVVNTFDGETRVSLGIPREEIEYGRSSLCRSHPKVLHHTQRRVAVDLTTTLTSSKLLVVARELEKQPQPLLSCLSCPFGVCSGFRKFMSRLVLSGDA